MSRSKSKRVLGMTYPQIAFLILFGCFSIVCLTVIVLVYVPNQSRPISTSTPPAIFPSPIGDLTQKSVANHLSTVGLSCKPSQINEPYGYTAICSGKSSSGRVEASASIASIDRNEGVYLIVFVLYQYGEYSEETATDILGKVASISYAGSEPNQASTWVRNHLSDDGVPVAIFGGVPFELSCNYAITNRCLVIGEEARLR